MIVTRMLSPPNHYYNIPHRLYPVLDVSHLDLFSGGELLITATIRIRIINIGIRIGSDGPVKRDSGRDLPGTSHNTTHTMPPQPGVFPLPYASTHKPRPNPTEIHNGNTDIVTSYPPPSHHTIHHPTSSALLAGPSSRPHGTFSLHPHMYTTYQFGHFSRHRRQH